MRPPRALRSVPLDERGVALVSFCGHCGTRPEPSALAAQPSRVCGHCGLGLVLHAGGDVAPRRDQPFLVVDATLSVCAVSAAAEELLGIDETQAVNKHIADFLVPADANAPSAEHLLTLLIEVAGGSGEPRTTVVRPRHEFGVRFRARIGSCGSPQAALLVLI
ncbi:MAG: PAS domain-containing protein [Solirubrobacteraceae bacterium]|nr:PAS domain-containing protein [Solirubrobacteraceae bacterium]